jgi:pimeloyl-ACP methyl ester carboxylesterase
MASPTPKSKRHVPQPPAPPEVVSPVWLAKALGVTLLVAFLCAYATFCYLFYQGQWQLVLHPARTSASPESIAGTPYDLIHFATDDSGTPQLTGWWIPATPNARYAHNTLLFLPGADGSLADSIPTLATLHNLGINVFAFDYRGYGQSSTTHPNQLNMTQDAESGWQYLTVSRHIPAGEIIPYGTGVGASLATHLAAAHTVIPALILDSPQADLLDAAIRDPRSNLVPTRMLFHELFPLTEPLATLHTPKLLISYGTSPASFHTASYPKVAVELATRSEALYTQSLTRFLDQYLSPTPAQLVPTAAPNAQNPH